ncbi:helix-turn-helix domain-containing protein [Halanaerobium salsuginis]|jgi:Zn-dependent peptidase ImmA (M78 family)/DNA-binding XRE family transcriptional regulator|uniref:Zn-dependent peptidase ImmA, M78 family n=1 Tax=Halanaerobium salsuginis TaxID=29563 RepID=A0A1I4MPT1_9FIRM|nr:XRE family transcriptional regulator [Halanaerobium salsuginis]SFM05238.1 Zn-dependent peptidase ImmA, M78 family [Halanaerobium salsuginis]
MNFNGERLKKSRIYRNMTISELADKIGVTKQAVSQYEKGVISPKPEVLFKLISTLNFPMDFFKEEDLVNSKIENTFFRALLSTKNLDLATQEVKPEIIVRIYDFLSNYLDFPKLDLPDLKNIETKDIEDVAGMLRSYWKLNENPISNMVSLLEKKGVIVSSLATDSHKIDAFTQIQTIADMQYYCVVLGNDKQSMVRRAFDAAHELGHIILHNKLVNIKDLSKEEFKKIEKEANQFAAAFLLPRNAFYADLINPTNLDSYLKLKKKWKVSIAAMVMRAKQLGRISSKQYQNLMKQISYRKWRRNEPYDDIWKVQRPQLFKKAIEILIENNVLTGSQIVMELSKENYSIKPEEIEALLDLEPGTLKEKQSPDNKGLVLNLKQKR